MPDQAQSSDAELLQRIARLLSAQLYLQIKARFETIPEQVDCLRDFELDYREIATVLRITPTHAAKELSLLKKATESSKNAEATKPVIKKTRD